MIPLKQKMLNCSISFHPFVPWRKAPSQPHINSSTPAITTLWEAPFLLKQRLIVPHSFARPQEMRFFNIRVEGFFHLFNAIFCISGKKSEFSRAEGKRYLILLVESSIKSLLAVSEQSY